MNRLSQTIKAIRDVLLYTLLFLSAISYHPTIIMMSRNAGYESGTILSRYIIILFVAVLILSFGLTLIRDSKLVRTYLVWLSVILVVALFILAFYDNRSMIHELRTYIIVLGSIMIGYNLVLKKRGFVFLVMVFCLTSLFSGIMQVMINNGGFEIADQYSTDAKNSLGAMLSTACFSLFVMGRFFDIKVIRIVFWVLAIATLVVIVTIRARMAFVALVIVGMYYFYLNRRNNNLLIAYGVVSIVVFFGVLIMPDFLINYLDASFTAGTQGDDFTSGRLSTYKEAIAFFINSPFMGNVMNLNKIGWVHNFLLLKLYQYGLFFSWPIIVLYFIILIKTIRQSIKCSPNGWECYAYVCLLIPYLISLTEPTFPFGPGTVNMFNFILLGMADSQS